MSVSQLDLQSDGGSPEDPLYGPYIFNFEEKEEKLD